MTLVRNPRFLMTLALTACLLVAGLASAQSSLAASKSCASPARKSGLSGGYFSKLRVTNRSCSEGKKVVYAYYECRMRKSSKKASCNGRTIRGLRCTEYRDPDLSIPTEFNARVTCKSGSKKVVHVYQQNT
ncbi:MAG TPA: hypothetical protein VD790_00070 [Thermoleophilaceae bacterium]|nr:hypothetical protein [Thermoleophilaceae bacterium]